MKRFISIGLVCALGTTPVFAEDVKTILEKVMTLEKEGKYQAALNELKWAQTELVKKNNEQIGKLLPAELAGLKGGEVEFNGALGMVNIEKQYSKGEDLAVKVSITSSASGGEGLAGLAALGSMAAMFGQQGSGQETFRVEGMTATLSKDAGNPDLTIFLTGGPILKLEMTNGSDTTVLKQMAEGLGVKKLSDALAGVG